MKTEKHQELTVKISSNRIDMGNEAAQDGIAILKKLLELQDTVNVMFAAAPSQNEVLAALVKADLDWNRINAFHMDEYLGLPEGAPQLFSQFLDRLIFKKLPFRQVFRICPQGAPEEICQNYSQLLTEHPLDVVFLGIGENGHIAFNDPPFAKFNDTQLVKVVELEERCRKQQVNDGCFATLNQVPTMALTVTIPAMLKAKYLFCVVPGMTKAEAVYHCLTGNVTEQWPASILQIQQNATLYLDSDSASMLS